MDYLRTLSCLMGIILPLIHLFISRHSFHQQFDIVINATSTGLTDTQLPLPASIFAQGALAYDMMYGRELPFLQHFSERGTQTSDGYGMLIGQAALSFERWTGHTIDVVQATATLKKQTK